MAASPHPIDAVATLIADHKVGGVDVRWESMDATFKFILGGPGVTDGNLFKAPPRPIERVDPVRPKASGKGIAKNALYITAGAPIAPIRFMGQAEEIRRIIVRLSLKWTAYGEGHALAVEINRYLFEFGIDKRIQLPSPPAATLVPPLRRFMPVNNNPSPNDILNDDILDFHALNSEPILSNPSNTIFYFAMNYSVDYITRPFK